MTLVGVVATSGERVGHTACAAVKCQQSSRPAAKRNTATHTPLSTRRHIHAHTHALPHTRTHTRIHAHARSRRRRVLRRTRGDLGRKTGSRSRKGRADELNTERQLINGSGDWARDAEMREVCVHISRPPAAPLAPSRVSLSHPKTRRVELIVRFRVIRFELQVRHSPGSERV